MADIDHFFRAFTGLKKADTTGQGTTADMLRTLFPTHDSRHKHGIDTALAAKRLRVSETTVRRWARGAQAPKKDHLKSLQKRSRQAATTKRGRAQSIKNLRGDERLARTKDNHAIVTVHGLQGPKSSTHTKDYTRQRNAIVNLSWEQYDQLVDTYVRGGPDAAKEYLRANLRNYPSDYQFIDVSSLGISTNSDRGSQRWY